MHNQLTGQIGQQTNPVQEKITSTTYSVQSSSLPQTNIPQTRGLNTSNTSLGNLTGQQSLGSGQQHFAGGQQSLVGGQQHFAGGQQPLTGGQQHFAGGQQPFASGQQPLTSGQQHFAGGQQSLVGGQQHFAGGQQPLVGGQQHFAGGQQPLVGGQQSLAGGQQPHTTGPLSGAKNTMNHHTIGNTGIGTITFRPIEGRFTKDKDWIGNMDPYCKFKIGWRTGKSSVAKSQGVNPVWGGDAVTLKLKNHEYAKLKCKDKDRLRPNSRLGKAQIPLAQVVQQGKVTQWVPILKRGTVRGEVLLEMIYTPGYI